MASTSGWRKPRSPLWHRPPRPLFGRIWFAGALAVCGTAILGFALMMSVSDFVPGSGAVDVKMGRGQLPDPAATCVPVLGGSDEAAADVGGDRSGGVGAAPSCAATRPKVIASIQRVAAVGAALLAVALVVALGGRARRPGRRPTERSWGPITVESRERPTELPHEQV